MKKFIIILVVVLLSAGGIALGYYFSTMGDDVVPALKLDEQVVTPLPEEKPAPTDSPKNDAPLPDANIQKPTPVKIAPQPPVVKKTPTPPVNDLDPESDFIDDLPDPEVE